MRGVGLVLVGRVRGVGVSGDGGVEGGEEKGGVVLVVEKDNDVF